MFLLLCDVVMHFTFDGNPKMIAISGVYSYTPFLAQLVFCEREVILPEIGHVVFIGCLRHGYT